MRVLQWISLAMLVLLLGMQASCGSAKVRTAAESARLRAEIARLNDQVAALDRRNRELELQVQVASAAVPGSSAEAMASRPIVVELSIDRKSFARDSDGDGRPDLVMLYVQSLDGRGRFEKMVGSVTANAVILPRDGEPVVIGRVQLTPAQVSDAYRYSFTGLHYTIDLPVQWPEAGSASAAETRILARVFYADALTGKEITAEQTISRDHDLREAGNR